MQPTKFNKVSPVHKMVYLQANFFEHWYYPMPEKGFSFFEIQTTLEKCNPPQTKRSPITWGVNPPSPGGVGVMVD